jgi:hypothetical protein
MIGFLSVLDRHEAGELNQTDAGELLGISERTFRQLSAFASDIAVPGPPAPPVASRSCAWPQTTDRQ